jgi:hypothetical protein
VIRYLKRGEIDDKSWDECIRSSFNGSIYGYTWFLDLVAEEWEALVENNYERVFPLVRRTKMNISYIYQPFFTQQLGLFSRSRLSPDILTEFIRAIPRHFKQVEINLNTLNNVEAKQFRFYPQINHELDLIHTYEKIRGSYSTNLKRNLKKASEAGLTLSRSIKPDLVIDLFRENRGKSILHLKDLHYNRLKRLVYTAKYKGMADVWGVYDQHNQLCAGAYFLQSNHKAVFLFSGLNEEGREYGAMPFLIDSYIKEHANHHLTFDFDGSNDPNLARFYKSFGAKECTYQRLKIDRLPLYLKPGIWLVKKLRSE